MGHAAHGEHDQRYDRADEFLEVVLGHWDSWDDDAIVLDKRTGLFAHPDKVRRLDHDGRVLPFARAVHRAALGAGPSGDDPGGTERTRPAVCGALGGAGVRHLPRAGTGAGRLRGVQAADRRSGARSGEGEGRCWRIYGGRRDARRGGGQGGADRQAAEGYRSAVAAVGGAEFRSSRRSRSTSRGAKKRSELDRRAGPCAIGCIRVLGKRNPTTRDFMDISQRGTFHDHPRFVGSPKDVADGWRNGSPARGLRRISWSLPRTCPAAMRSSCASSSPNCNAAGCFTRTIRGTTLRENLGSRAPALRRVREVLTNTRRDTS